MNIQNPKKKTGAYSLSEFKKMYPDAYPDATEGFVFTIVTNNVFRSKLVKTEVELLTLIK